MKSSRPQVVYVKESERYGAADRRRSLRTTVESNGWLSAEAGSCSKDHRVSIMNLSMDGVGFTSDSPLEVGSVHWIVMDAACLRASGRVRVVNCREGRYGYECGAEFF